MVHEKHWHNPVGSEYYRLGDLFAHEEDKHFFLENVNEYIPEVDTHEVHEEDKTVVPKNSKWYFGFRPDKITSKMF
jgi:hypothetical protein